MDCIAPRQMTRRKSGNNSNVGDDARSIYPLSVPCDSYKTWARVSSGNPSESDGHIPSTPSMKHPLLSQVLKTRWTMFDQLPDDTNARNGQPASRQTVYYRVIGWPQAQQSMQSRAYTIRDTARKWSTTFKELQSSALPCEPDDIASMINRVHDVLRGWTVQVSVTHA